MIGLYAGTHVNREGQILRAYVENLQTVVLIARVYDSEILLSARTANPYLVNWRELADHICARGQNISSKRIISRATVERYILNESRDSLTTRRYPIILLATL